MDNYKYIKEHHQAIKDSWLVSESEKLAASIDYAVMTQMATRFLDLLADCYHTPDGHPLDLTGWGTIFRQRYQISLPHMINLIQSVRRHLIVGLSTHKGLAFLLNVNKLIDPAIVNLITYFSEMTEALLNERLVEMEQITMELANNTDETDRALIKVQAMYDVSREISATLNTEAIMQLAVKNLTRMTYAQSSAVWSFDDTGLHLTASSHLLNEMFSLNQRNGGTIWQAVVHKQASVVTAVDCDEQDKAILNRLNATHMLVIPLVAQAILVGVITLHSQEARLLDDMDLAQAVAQQVAIGWQNGQLFGEIQQLNAGLEERIAIRTKELIREKDLLETIYQIAGHLTTTLDLNTLITQTLGQIATAVGANSGLVMLNDDSYSSDLFCQATLPDTEDARLTSNSWLPLCHGVMTSQQSTVIGNIRQEDRWQMPEDTPVHSIIASPIKADRDLHGVLILMQTEPDAFTTSHLRLLAVIATQLATAINNAQLHGYVTDQVVRLGEMLHTQAVETSQKQAILSSIADGVIASDKDHKIILVNPAAELILEQSAMQLVNQPIESVLLDYSPSSKKMLHKAIYEFDNGHDIQNEQEFILEIGSRIINARLAEALIADEGKVGNVIVLRDISKEVEADRAKTEFITTVSHELRTPMTSISGYMFLMQQGAAGPLTDKQREFIKIINHNSERLTLLINDLLDLSKIEAGRIKLDRKETALEELAGTIMKSMLIPAQQKGLELFFNAEDDLPNVTIDRNRISQVLTNLIGNAINYTPEGSVTVTLRQVADAVEISVADTGIGIQPEDLTHIFERFFRSCDGVVQSNSGTGLGLSIVKSFIEMHNGRIWVDSKPNNGSTFKFILPVSKQATAVDDPDFSPEELSLEPA